MGGPGKLRVNDSIGLDEDVAFRSDPESRTLPAHNDWLVDAVPPDCERKKFGGRRRCTMVKRAYSVDGLGKRSSAMKWGWYKKKISRHTLSSCWN